MSVRGKIETIDDRVEFIGNLAPEIIQQKYKYKSAEDYFKKGNANPIKMCIRDRFLLMILTILKSLKLFGIIFTLFRKNGQILGISLETIIYWINPLDLWH